jgi:hypothetical protein
LYIETGGREVVTDQQLVLFSYSDLDTETRIVVRQKADEIKSLMRRSAQDIIDIGLKLIDVKVYLGHGNFGSWLKVEFDWSDDTARRFMNVAERFGQKPQIAEFAPSALYLLAAPSTSDEAREEALERAANGEAITFTIAKGIKETHEPAPPTAPADEPIPGFEAGELDNDDQPAEEQSLPPTADPDWSSIDPDEYYAVDTQKRLVYDDPGPFVKVQLWYPSISRWQGRDLIRRIDNDPGAWHGFKLVPADRYTPPILKAQSITHSLLSLNSNMWYPVDHSSKAVYNAPFPTREDAEEDARYTKHFISFKRGNFIQDSVRKGGGYISYKLVAPSPAEPLPDSKPSVDPQPAPIPTWQDISNASGFKDTPWGWEAQAGLGSSNGNGNGRKVDDDELDTGRHKPKVNRAGSLDEPHGYDACQTPAYALDPLLPYLDLAWTIWEPASGEGSLVEALYDAGYKEDHVVATDILTGQNFFEHQPDQPWDCLVTNPPYSIKYEWLSRCFALGKPFALLVPVEMLGAKTAQELLKAHDFEIMLLDQRIDFKMPNKGYEGNGAQFPTLWLTHHLLPQQIMFGSIEMGKREFKQALAEETRA